ncbi:MAG: ABC transporter ATP-binding protein [Firmicutes bacterium]|nr:ABC transporter ATP-binding protein [Bacillota bacterium]
MYMSNVMIDVHNVSKRYGSVTAVSHITFAVNRGEICGFLGPNGAGKTTTLRMLLGLVRPTSGYIVIQGVDVASNAPKALNSVGAIIEESRFYPYLTGEQNLRQVLRLRGLAVSSEALASRLSEVGLGKAGPRKVKGYSLGMRQRLALALAMLQDPEILVLDEPMNGLDPAAMRDFRLHLLKLAESGVTILLSSHILSEVEQLATRLVFINQGQVVGVEDRQQGTGAKTYVKVLESEQIEAWFESRGAVAERLADGTFVVSLTALLAVSELVRDMVAAGFNVIEIRPYQENLELQYLERMAHPQEVFDHAQA